MATATAQSIFHVSAVVPAPGHTTYILSGYQDDKTAHESNLAHEGLAHDLAQLIAVGRIDTMAHCRGAYKGTPERSIAVTGVDQWSLHKTILELAVKYRQESILAITGTLGLGTLYFTNGDTELIGQYQAIDSTNGIDAYTEVCATGETFTFV